MNQAGWESSVKEKMTNAGWVCDRDDETNLGFSFEEGDKKWIRDYEKKTRKFVQFNGNQIVNLKCTPRVGNNGMD